MEAALRTVYEVITGQKAPSVLFDLQPVRGMEGVREAESVSYTHLDVYKRQVYTDLRMVYEKLGQRSCPYCGRTISAADCKEETEKNNDDFHVYMYCSECGRRMDKITLSLIHI